MSMTDLSTLALPAWAVPTAPRQEAVGGHSIDIREHWWRDKISARGLPGALPSGAALTRAEVWEPTDDVFTLLWRVLAWGSGSRLRQNVRRLNSIREDVPRAEKLLKRAKDMAAYDPAGAYAVLRHGRRNEIRAFGPSFFTKFLYFAGGGNPEHPCLILDRVVATVLHDKCGWTSLHRSGGWPADTYQRYCGLLARWAKEHRCEADEIERTLFASKGSLSG